MKKVIGFVKKEIVLCIAILLAVVSCFFVRPSKEYWGYIDFRTLAILFSLMAVMAGLKVIGVFEIVARFLIGRVHRMLGMELLLVGFCFISSMFITNDVALITFVPLTLELLHLLGEEYCRRYRIRIVMMQTIAANLGSMLTPLGNPQNLYLYGKSEMPLLQFVDTMLPYTLAALVGLVLWIVLSNISDFRNPQKMDIHFEKREPFQYRFQLIKYGVLFVLCVLSVLHILPFYVLFGVVLVMELITHRRVLLQIDYSLLGTFVALFIFIGNLGRISVVSDWLSNLVAGHEVMVSIAASQVMSNVPAAILLSGFSTQYSALLIGVNLGGLGTLIASMASLISYKQLSKDAPKEKLRYLGKFTLMSIIFLAGLLLVYWII